MKRLLSSALLLGAFVATGIYAQGQGSKPAAQSGPKIGDTVGNMSVTGFSHLKTEKLENGNLKFTVRTDPGKRIIGDWVKQGLHVEVGDLEAIVNVEASGAKMLISAIMGGQITADVKRASSNAESKESQIINLKAASADYTGSRNELSVKGAITLTRSDPGAHESLTATGSGGVITLSEQGASANGIKSAVLNGPVVLTMTGNRKGDDGKPTAFHVNGNANKVVFNDAARTVVFTGNVKLTGDDPSIGGEISGVSSATITLTKSGEIESIDMEGDPGKTIVTEKKKGGGRR